MAGTRSKKSRQSMLMELEQNLTTVLTQIDNYEKTINDMRNSTKELEQKLTNVSNWSMEQEALLKTSQKALQLQEDSLRQALIYSEQLEKSIQRLLKKNKGLVIGGIASSVLAAIGTAIGISLINEKK